MLTAIVESLLPVAFATNRARNVTVVATSPRSTLVALREAGVLASRLGTCVTLVVTQIVPYPLPLTRPPVPADLNVRRFRVLAGESPVETTVRIYLCRDEVEGLRTVLRPNSLVVIGGRRSWWPTRERRLARQLAQSGHEVVFTEA